MSLWVNLGLHVRRHLELAAKTLRHLHKFLLVYDYRVVSTLWLLDGPLVRHEAALILLLIIVDFLVVLGNILNFGVVHDNCERVVFVTCRCAHVLVISVDEHASIIWVVCRHNLDYLIFLNVNNFHIWIASDLVHLHPPVKVDNACVWHWGRDWLEHFRALMRRLVRHKYRRGRGGL